jgi:hypothetical protein
MSSSWHHSVRIRALAAATLLLAFVLGCGTAPVGPDPSTGGGLGGGDPAPAPTGPEVLVVNPDGSVSYTRPPADSSGASAAGAVLVEPVPIDRKLSQSVMMDGDVGGKMRCGRFVLLVPAGAFTGTGTVTMSMADSTVMIVDLAIEPADLNGFQKPIDLAITTTDISVSPESLQIYYYNPDSKEWLSLSCDTAVEDDPRLMEEGVVTVTRGLLTPLMHFSKYSAGKAGW